MSQEKIFNYLNEMFAFDSYFSIIEENMTYIFEKL